MVVRMQNVLVGAGQMTGWWYKKIPWFASNYYGGLSAVEVMWLFYLVNRLRR